MKHTPGPIDIEFYQNQFERYVFVVLSDSPTNKSEAEKLASLFKASPEMLEALEKAEKAIDSLIAQIPNNGLADLSFVTSFRKANSDAIRKATGAK